MRRLILLAVVGAAALGLVGMPSASATQDGGVYFCHTAPPDGGGKIVWGKTMPKAAARAHYVQHDGDIFPYAFSYKGTDYAARGSAARRAECLGDDENPPPPAPTRSRYRIVTRMPVATTKVKFYANAQVRVRYSCGREEFRVRLTKAVKDNIFTQYVWMDGNSARRTILRVREDGALRHTARARC